MQCAPMPLLRSEEMVYMQSIVPAEACRSFVHEAARLECIQFTDVRLFVFFFSKNRQP